MEIVIGVIGFLQAVFAVFTADIVLTAIFAGLFFGAIYPGFIDPRMDAFDGVAMGTMFVISLFIWRLWVSLLTGAVLSPPGGWVGIVLLWGVYSAFIWVGQVIKTALINKYRKLK